MFFCLQKREEYIMKKFYGVLAVFLFVFAFLAGCGNTEEQNKKDDNTNPVTEQSGDNKEASFPVTIKDASNEDVVIEEKPEKIISLIPSNTEIVYALGEGDAVVGVSDTDNYPEEVVNKEQVSSYTGINMEKVLALEPDIVLAHQSNLTMWETGIQQLRDNGITVLVVNDAQNFDAVYTSIEMIGKAIGRTTESEALINDMKTKLDELKTKAEAVTDKKKVFIEISGAPEIYASGKDSFINEMLEVIQAENAVQENGYPQMSEEAVIELNPDIILVTYGAYVEDAPAQVMDRDGWQDVTAIKEKQVYEVNEDLVSRTGPRIVEGVEELAKSIYPEVFGE